MTAPGDGLMTAQVVAPCADERHYYECGEDKIWRCACGASFTNVKV